MGLETGQFIPELNPANPAGADNISEGDNHLRLVKTCVLGSFPSFVGTSGAPAFVSKSEAELNDCAEKSANETIAGNWSFSGTVDFSGPVPTIGGVDITTQNDLDTVDKNLRRPPERTLAGAGTVAQSDEGDVIRYTGGGGDALTFNSLIQGTVGTIKNVGSGNLTLAEGTATISHLEGGSTQTGPRTLTPGSVAEYHYTATGAVEIWGNGIA